LKTQITQKVMHIEENHAQSFHNDGYVMMPGLLTEEEIGLIIEAFGGEGRVASELRQTYDGSGKAVNVASWGTVGDDIWSAVTTRQRGAHSPR
jgi:hypothetical protein